MPSGSASGSAAAGTMTPESSAAQPSTGISHSTPSTGRSSGSAACARGMVVTRNQAGRHSISPVTSTTIGTSGLNMLTESEPRLACIFRSSRLPPWPCSPSPANAPMSDLPVIAVK